MLRFPSIVGMIAFAAGCSSPSSDPTVVDVNSDEPAVVLARLCAFVPDEPLCRDPKQAEAFENLLATARRIGPDPVFADTASFIAFVQGKPSPSSDRFPALIASLGKDSPLFAWLPVTIPARLRKDVAAAFVT